MLSRQALEERAVRSTTPSLLSATVGQRLLSRLDDGSGCTSPDRVLTLWTEEGIRNSRDILQTLDFSLEEKVSLAELTLALDNELLVSGNGIHQAALISYKNEIQYLQVIADQACKERDKVKADLEWADRTNLQLVREVDDRHATMESLNETKIKGIEQEYRDRLTVLRSQSEQESEVLLQQVERERAKLREEVEVLRTQESTLQEEVCNATQENGRLEEDLSLMKLKLSEAEGTVSRLQRDLDLLLQDKFGNLDPNNTGLLTQEERFTEIIKEYELQCRELRDRNDELNSELEMLKSQGTGRRARRARDDTSTLAWSSQRSLTTESDSDDPEMRRGVSPLSRKKLLVADKNGLGSLESLPGPIVSIETEMAMQQLKENHSQEVHDLKVELETKVNYYERSMDLMRQNMEVERKDISQGFKMEISELEDQKAQAEQQIKNLKETLEKLQTQLQGGLGGPGWGSDQERRVQRERAELEQNYAREIGNLVQRLSAEKDQLEAELKLKMDQEVMVVRSQLEEAHSENSALKDRLTILQQDIQRLEEDFIRKKKKLDEMEREHEKKREEEERLHKENSKYREEVLDLSSRNLQLSSENAELSSRLRADQGAVQMLTERLAQVSREQEEGGAMVRQLSEMNSQHERERLHLQAGWQHDKELLERELATSKEKLQRLSEVESALTSLTLKHQWLEQDKERMLREAEERTKKMEKLQESLSSLDSQTELLRSQLQTVSQERSVQAQEVASHQRMLQEAQGKVEELEASVGRLNKEKELLHLAQKRHEEQATVALQEECQNLQQQNQDLLHRLAELQAQGGEVQRLAQECLSLKNRQTQLETARVEAQDQALRADTALTLAQAQHTREVQQLREQVGGAAGSRDQQEQLQALLAEEQRRSHQLEETLHTQAQQASSRLSLQQEQYEAVMGNMQERMEEVETKLKSLRMMLQEKVNQLKEQLAKNAKSDLLLKDLYVENSQLMKALQVTEQRQKSAEKRNFVLEEKITSLNKLLRKIAPTSLAT